MSGVTELFRPLELNRKLSPGGGAGIPNAAEEGSIWRKLDLPLVLSVLLLGCFGVAMIYSSTRGSDPENYQRLNADRQAIFLALGILGMFIVAWLGREIIRRFIWGIYGAGMLVLLIVLSPLGTTNRGVQGWFEVGIFQIQPSEFMKVAFIAAMATVLSGGGGILSSFLGVSATWTDSGLAGGLRLSRLLGALLLTGMPVGLILLQPDAGTSAVFVAISMAMIFVAGGNYRQGIAIVVISGLALILLLSSSVLEPYQQERLTVFINPDTEEVDTYNLEQAQIAVGNGGFWGQGYGQGTQTQLGRVPEQHTDFIFTAIGEELGFVGAVGTLLVYVFMLWRIAKVGWLSGTSYSKLLTSGVLAMLAFQAFQAAGMVVGLMPVTGVPFPLLSYGGSSVIATCLAVGLVLGLNPKEPKFLNPSYIR